jgi:hypothetical protein
MLEITFTRTGPRACATTVRRDRASFELHGFGRTAELPHDLAHYEVERALGLRHGFWGCVAAGATFQSMTLVQGRRQPAWAERSRELLRRHRGELTEAEALVGLMLKILHQGIGDDGDAIRRRLAGRWTPSHGGAPIGPPDVWRACQALATAGARWRALPTGGTLTVTWPDAPERARGRRRARPSTARRALA